MVRDFLDRVFDGASDALLVHLARDNKLTPKQRRIVRQLLDEKESDK
jgi:predicted transcriptional regulator